MAEPIRGYLRQYYDWQGGVEFDCLQDQEFVVAECRSCGLVYQQELGNDLLMARLYNVWIDPIKVFDQRERTRPIEYYARLGKEMVEIVRTLGRRPSELELFDFGMGWSQWCQMAQAHGCKVSGTELSTARIEHARRRGICVVEGDLPRGHYDFINTQDVIEHVADPRGVVFRLKAALKECGILKISVPDGRDAKHALRQWDWAAARGSRNSMMPITPLEHVNCFTRASLLRLADVCGLVPIRTPAIPPEWSFRPVAGARARIKRLLRPHWHRLRGLQREPLYQYFRKKEERR